MFLSIIASVAMTADTEAKIVSASLFKNGYAMVMREIEVTGRSTSLPTIPVASLGTFWVTTSPGLKLKSIINTTQEVAGTSYANDMASLLRLNVGKQISVTVSVVGTTTQSIVGKLNAVQGDLIIIEDVVGRLTVVRANSIIGLELGKDAATSEPTKNHQRVLRFSTEGTGKIYFLGLEQGLMWSAGYTIDLTEANKLKYLAKSTVVNDLGDLNDIELRFVTGFPNVPWAQMREPLLSGDSVASLVGMLQNLGLPQSGFGGRRDAQVMNQAPGAFGGGGFAADEMMISGGGGEQAEDLFFYKQPGVQMKRGDRAFFLLFQAESEFKHVYTLDLPNTINEYEPYRPQNTPPMPYDVWHTIRFKNTANQPLTTAPATVYKNGQIMGQDTLMYTSGGGEVNLKMSKALDVKNDVDEEEVSRERAKLQHPSYGTFDWVTVKGTIVLKNNKSESVDLTITKLITGDLISSTDTPKVVKTAKGLRQVNSASKLTWNLALAKGATKTITYNYSIYVRN